MKSLTFALGLTVLLLLPVTARANGFSFQTVTSPGDPDFTQLLGINNSSVIAGYFGDGSVVPNSGFAFVLPSSFSPENFPGSTQTQVVGINGSGETVGFYMDTLGNTHGFTDVAGTFTAVNHPLGPTSTQLLGVNNAGEVAGYYINAAGNAVPFTQLGGVFAGISFPGLVNAQATDVNNAGWVTGFNLTSSTTSEGFLDQGGTFTFLEVPGSVFTQALGLNNNGEVVGSYIDAAGNTHGFIYNIGTGVYTIVNDPNAVGPGGTAINGINDQGQIVGFFSTGVTTASGVSVTDGFIGSSSVSTPEPGSLVFLGAGLIAIACKFRKQAA